MSELSQNNLIGWIQLVIYIVVTGAGLFTVYLNLRLKVLSNQKDTSALKEENKIMRQQIDSSLNNDNKYALALQANTLTI